MLSAIKVARVMSAIPCLGTHFPLWKIARLKSMGFTKAWVWLDADKWKEGVAIAERCSMCGLSAKAILTNHDPKEYSEKQIQDYVKQKKSNG